MGSEFSQGDKKYSDLVSLNFISGAKSEDAALTSSEKVLGALNKLCF